MFEKIKAKLGIAPDIGEPPYDYDLLISLDEKEYPKYLKRMYKTFLGKDLNLKNPKTFSEKIQWLKLYDNSPLKTTLTDKVLVRDYVKEKIGEEYLKPVLQVCKTFDEINFDELPESFIIKANHGCKWQYKIKNKSKFLEKKELVEYVKRQFTGWLEQSFFPWAGFEMQYKNIVPQILIEPLLLNTDSEYSVEYEVYCFNGEPQIMQKIKHSVPAEYSLYDKDFAISPIVFNPSHVLVEEQYIDENLKKAAELAKVLSKDFKLVRVDWLVQGDKFYFNEMTFTPYSGFYVFDNRDVDVKLGKMLNLKK